MQICEIALQRVKSPTQQAIFHASTDRSSYREFVHVQNRRKSADRGSGTSEIAGPSRNGRIGFYHATRSDRVRGAVKAVCRFMLLRWRFRGPNVPVGPARVFASRESLGKSIPSEWCCTPFSNCGQPLSASGVAGTSDFGCRHTLWCPHGGVLLGSRRCRHGEQHHGQARRPARARAHAP